MTQKEKAQERYECAIRKFTTCDLLEFFSKMSIEAYNDNKRAFTIVDVPYYNKRTGERGISKGFNYGQWDLVQICYNSIKYSNDYRGTKVNEMLAKKTAKYIKKYYPNSNIICFNGKGHCENSLLNPNEMIKELDKILIKK